MQDCGKRDELRHQHPVYLEKISADHIVTRDEVGHKGEGYTIVIVDQFTGLTSMVPVNTKHSDEVEMALRRFVGKKRPGVVQVASDRAPEIRKAVRDLGFASEPKDSQPIG